MKMFYTIPIFTMFINGFVADIGTVEMNTTDVIQNTMLNRITSITNITEEAPSTTFGTVATYPTSIISTKSATPHNYTTNSTSDGMRYIDSNNFIIGSCMLYTLSQL